MWLGVRGWVKDGETSSGSRHLEEEPAGLFGGSDMGKAGGL